MSSGLIALLDDVAGIAKIAAASVDDAAAQAAKAGAKAAGVVIDDAAVTPRYVVGFAADRELPIIGRIALGSLKNKLFYLMPAALALSFFAPWAISPLLMLGGAYLCFEGFEKVAEIVRPHADHDHGDDAIDSEQAAKALEESKIRGAIGTDFILSAEIMAITLASVAASDFWVKATVLSIVGIGITAAVYGAVALIVKADDVGVAMALSERPVSALLRRPPGDPPTGADRLLSPLTRAFGRGLVHFMPYFLKTLALVGTVAMLWVGGGIIVHGLEEYGLTAIGHAIDGAAHTVVSAVPFAPNVVEWLVKALGAGLFGLVVGGLIAPVAQWIIAPLLMLVNGRKAVETAAPGS